MVERIKTLLESRQLTPTQFADAIGVARPIVSHVLSGRNKPSLEVVQRILAAMPDLAMPWLLNGTGPMLATSIIAPVVADTEAKPPAAPPSVVLPMPELGAVTPATAPQASLASLASQAPQVATNTPASSGSQHAVSTMPLPSPVTQLPPPNTMGGGALGGARMPNVPRIGAQPKRFTPSGLGISVPSMVPGVNKEVLELPVAALVDIPAPVPAPFASAPAAVTPPVMEAPATLVEAPANALPPKVAPGGSTVAADIGTLCWN